MTFVNVYLKRVANSSSIFGICNQICSATDFCLPSDDLSDLLCALLFLGGSGALATPRPVRGHLASLNRYILNQATIVEVDQRRDWNVLLLDVLVIQDRLDGLLDFGRGDAFIILSCAFWHIKIELQDIVELVARVQIAKALSDT